MENKVKIAILASNYEFISDVAKKMNAKHPVDISFYTDLKTFIAHCMAQPTDLVAMSLGFPHKNVTRFPKIFKMVLNKPVISFGESDDPATNKLQVSVKSDYQIRGILNPHNLWMKVQTFLKDKEEAEKLRLSGGDDPDDKTKKISSKNITHISGKNNLPGNMSPKSNKIGPLVSSHDPLEDEPLDASTLAKLGQELGLDDPNSMAALSKALNAGTSDKNLSSSQKPSNIAHVTGVAGQEAYGRGQGFNESDSPSIKNGTRSSENNTNIGQGTSNGNMASVIGSILEDENNNSLNNDPKNKMKEKSSNKNGDKKNKDVVYAANSMSKLFDDEGHRRDSEGLSPNLRKAGDKLADKLKEDNLKNKSKKLENKNGNKVNPSQHGKKLQAIGEKPNVDGVKPSADSDKSPQPKGQKKNNKEEKNSKENSKFGKIKFADEKDVKKREVEKKKKQKAKTEDIVKDALEEACKAALKKVYGTDIQKFEENFETSINHCFIVELDQYKGFLLLATNEGVFFDEDRVNQFHDEVIEQLKAKNVFGEISHSLTITANLANYIDRVDEFSEFHMGFAEEKGSHQFVTFVKREVVRPSFEESDKKDMSFVNINLIPPQTPVNFDAYIYLPRNKRFVRYLKEGRSLSLAQAKRHSQEENGEGKFYLPNDQIKQFLKFFIQNTLNWEFALHDSGSDEDVA